MTCCALGNQDAILRHVASRGDRTSPSFKIELRTTELSSRTRQEFTPERYDISLVPRRSCDTDESDPITGSLPIPSS